MDDRCGVPERENRGNYDRSGAFDAGADDSGCVKSGRKLENHPVDRENIEVGGNNSVKRADLLVDSRVLSNCRLFARSTIRSTSPARNRAIHSIALRSPIGRETNRSRTIPSLLSRPPILFY